MLRLLAVVAATLLLAGCGGSGGEGGDTLQGPVQVTVTGDSIEPVGRTIKVTQDQEVVMTIDSDRAVELHLHTDGDGQEFEVKPAQDQRFTFSIDTPGTYELEAHPSGTVVLKVEVE